MLVAVIGAYKHIRSNRPKLQKNINAITNDQNKNATSTCSAHDESATCNYCVLFCTSSVAFLFWLSCVFNLLPDKCCAFLDLSYHITFFSRFKSFETLLLHSYLVAVVIFICRELWNANGITKYFPTSFTNLQYQR